MQLRAEQLEGHLAKALAPAYAIHGDEPLLALEAVDALRAAARSRGFTERQVFEPGRGFDWSEFAHATQSLSLFAEKKVLELRLPSGKPGTQGGEAIATYCAQPAADLLLLVSVPRLDRATQNSAWFGALGRAGVVLDIWPVERARLPAWIAARLARQRQSASPEVLEFLADRVEGNLLAAHQEVRKLSLVAGEGALTLEAVQEAVSNVARYDPNDAAEALLAGDLARYARVIEGLRGEGEAPPYLLFAVSSALFALQRGERVFNRRVQAAVEAAARRYTPARIEQALAHTAAIDRAIKGVGAGEPWQEFLALGLKLTHGSNA
ncbi:MAG TPA: DNA polymerase III subunit delta [Burkholderiales bacterium]|nr:DNA polymerase III subunit delta [Burkholderiales bacterium]